MTNEVIFSLKIEQELHAEFMAEAEALQMSATQIIHNFMREFIQRQREPVYTIFWNASLKLSVSLCKLI